MRPFLLFTAIAWLGGCAGTPPAASPPAPGDRVAAQAPSPGTGPPPAGEPAPPPFRPDALTLADALRVGGARSPALRTARARVAAAEAAVVTAGQWPQNPVVSVGGSTDALAGREGEGSVTAALAQTFETGGQRGRRVEAAEARVLAARAEYGDAERRLRAEVAVAFAGLLLAARKLEIATASAELRARILELAEARVKAGDIPEVDANLVRLELKQAEAERAAAARDVDRIEATLRAVLGLEEGARLRPAGDFSTPRPGLPADVAPLVVRALAQRPDLVSLRHARVAARGRVALERASVAPDVTVEAFYDFEQSKLDRVPLDRDHLIGIAVALPIPLFNRRQGEILEAEREVGRIEAEIRALEVQVRRDVAVAVAGLLRATERATAYEKDILPLSERNLEQHREAYRLGQVGTLEVLRAEEEAIKVRAAYVEALRDRAAALGELEAAIGGEP